MIYRLLKGILKAQMIFSWFTGIMGCFHLVFYPNAGGISTSKDWTNILFCFSTGLVCQYFLLHFFTEQEQEEN